MRRFHSWLQTATPFVPMPIRRLVRQIVPLYAYDLARREVRNPLAQRRKRIFSGSPCHLGVIEDVMHYHRHYVGACEELEISYTILDLLSDAWIPKVRGQECDAYLVWPSSFGTTPKAVVDSRLKILEKDLGKVIYPTWRECWLTENKPRQRDWLLAHGLPTPRTWVLHRLDDVQPILDDLSLPIVSKTAMGASGSGVKVIRTRLGLRRLAEKAFGKGLRPRNFHPKDRLRGTLYLQEFLQDASEWRMVRIGDSYFGYRKEPGATGLHSASHRWSWLDPGVELLNLLKRVTDAGRFRSMNVDVFLSSDGRLLVNELHTVFGCSTPEVQMKVDGIEGRYRHDSGSWVFEPGQFSQNHMCNLRITDLLDRLGVALKQ